MMIFFKQNKALTIAITGFIVWCGYAISEYSKLHEPPKLPNSAEYQKYTYPYLNSYKNYILPVNTGKSTVLGSNNSDLVKLALNNYTLEKEGFDNIESAKCIAMRYKPKSRNFPWVQMWTDNKTGKIIKVKYWNSNKQLKKNIKLSHNSNLSKFKLPDQSLCSDIYMPGGYKLLNVSKKSDNAHLLVFGDGLNIVCISVEKNAAKSKLISVMKWDYGLIAQRYNKNFLCTIVADLPNEEILKIADSTAKSSGIIQ